jgi:hypothetical protein
VPSSTCHLAALVHAQLVAPSNILINIIVVLFSTFLFFYLFFLDFCSIVAHAQEDAGCRQRRLSPCT